jgi:hypothetical protein
VHILNVIYGEAGRLKKYVIALFFISLFISHSALSQQTRVQDVKTQVMEKLEIKTQVVKMLETLGRSIFDFAISIKKPVAHVQKGLLSEYLFSDAITSFRSIDDLLKLYIDETNDMVYRKFMENKGWTEELKKDGFIDSAVIAIGNTILSVGEISSVNIEDDYSFYIDERGEVHYVYNKAEDPLSFDLSLSFSGFKSYVLGLERSPKLFFLYDTHNNQYSTLLGRREDIPEGINRKHDVASRPRVVPTLKNLIIFKKLDVENSGLELIAIYRYKAGRAAIQLFGLIGVMILTILLLSFVVYFAFQSLKKSGVQAMGDEDKADVIGEIDKELSGIGKEEKEPASGPPPGKKKKDEAAKRLEEDGIFINE